MLVLLESIGKGLGLLYFYTLELHWGLLANIRVGGSPTGFK